MATWSQEETLLRSYNVSEETITEIYCYSLHQFNSDRSYYLHKEEFSSEENLCEYMDLDANLNLFDSIENPTIRNKLKKLTQDEAVIIKMHYDEKLSLIEISHILNEKYSTVQQQLYRLKNKIKK